MWLHGISASGVFQSSFQEITAPNIDVRQFKHTKGTSLCQSTHFEPSTVKIITSVYGVGDVSKNKKERKGEGHIGHKGYIAYYIKTQKSVKSYTDVAKSSVKNSQLFDLTSYMTSAQVGCYRLKGSTLQLYKIYFCPMTSVVALTTGTH